jgi:hypothetical protein
MLRGATEIEAAQLAVDAVADGTDDDCHWEMLLDAGLDYGGARRHAQELAASLYSRLSEHVLNGPPHWRRAIEVQMQAACIGGALVGSHLEGAPDDGVLIGYEELRDGAACIVGFDHPESGEVLARALALDYRATYDAATWVGIALLEAMKDKDSFSEDEEIVFGSAMALAWFEGLMVIVQLRRQLA